MENKEIFVAIIDDRHTYIEVKCFSSLEKAVSFCQDYLISIGAEDTIEEELSKDAKDEGWMYLAIYSCEGDFVGVVKTIIDKEA